MKLPHVLLAATAALILMTSSTYAQATPPASAAASPPAAATTAGTAGAPADDIPAGTGVKAIRQACREEVTDQSLRGEARMKAISACVVKKRPDLAQREQCRIDGWEKGLRKDELKSFVKDCAKAKG